MIGPKDIDNNTIEVARRDNLTKEVVDEENIEDYVDKLLLEIQKNLFNKAKKFREANTHKADNYEEFKKIFKNQNGFVYAHWDGSSETENKIKKETKATIRCIPLDYGKETGKCIVTGKKSGNGCFREGLLNYGNTNTRFTSLTRNNTYTDRNFIYSWNYSIWYFRTYLSICIRLLVYKLFWCRDWDNIFYYLRNFLSYNDFICSKVRYME